MSKLFRGASVYDSAHKSFLLRDVLVGDTGKIAALLAPGEPAAADEVVDCTGYDLIPGLVDIHTHGRLGSDFATCTAQDVARILQDYARRGTTSVMATLQTVPLADLQAAIARLQPLRTPAPGRAHLLGIHLEARFLSPKRPGAHAPSLLALPAEGGAELVEQMLPLPVRVTVAPELAGAEEFIRHAVTLGCSVSAGHSDATYAEAVEALGWGVNSFTHTYNAMRPMHHREPGIITAALLQDSAYAEFIGDGCHLHPEVLRLARRVKCVDRFVLVTDSVAGAGCTPAQCAALGLHEEGGCLRDEQGTICGSCITLWDALKNLMKFCGESLEQALPAATSNPAAAAGVADVCGALRPGLRADMLMVTGRTDLQLHRVFVAGHCIA